MNGTENHQRNGRTRGLKPFTRGDSRINRTGRPKGFDEMRKVAIQLACETVTLSNGRRVSCAEAILRSWLTSPEPTLQKLFLLYCFGPVPENKVEATDLENRSPIILRLNYERPIIGQPPAPGLIPIQQRAELSPNASHPGKERKR
jgi:hypothetical protein